LKRNRAKHKPHCGEDLFTAKGAAFITAWGNVPGICSTPKPPALKARFIPVPVSV
jgi:hypothetical protein